MQLDLDYYQIADGLVSEKGAFWSACFFIEELMACDGSTSDKLDDLQKMIDTGFLEIAPGITDLAWFHLTRLKLDDIKSQSRQSACYESDVRSKFYGNLRRYIRGAFKVDIPMSSSYQPDGFVMVDGVLHAVEIKRGSFNKPALAQLLGYMREFGCERGIAVAKKLTIQLPDCISFVGVQLDSSARA